jgi:biopolymer transport protein ExbB/TolQ
MIFSFYDHATLSKCLIFVLVLKINIIFIHIIVIIIIIEMFILSQMNRIIVSFTRNIREAIQCPKLVKSNNKQDKITQKLIKSYESKHINNNNVY